MEPRFKALPLERLQHEVEELIYTLLERIDEDDTIDCEDIRETLEDFAGRAYIVRTKIENELHLSRYDREYLTELINTTSITARQ